MISTSKVPFPLSPNIFPVTALGFFLNQYLLIKGVILLLSPYRLNSSSVISPITLSIPKGSATSLLSSSVVSLRRFSSLEMASETSFTLLDFSATSKPYCSGFSSEDSGIDAISPAFISIALSSINFCTAAGVLSNGLPVLLLIAIGFPSASILTSTLLLPGTSRASGCFTLFVVNGFTAATSASVSVGASISSYFLLILSIAVSLYTTAFLRCLPNRLFNLSTIC